MSRIEAFERRLAQLEAKPNGRFLRKLNILIFEYMQQSPGVKQVDIARELSVHRSTLTKWLDGTNLIEKSLLAKICQCIQATPEQQQDLYQSYLGLDVLPPAPSAEVESCAAPPHQMPAPVPDFVGREDVLAELVAVLRGNANERAVVIGGLRGMGGIGKTELALVVAHQTWDDYPDAHILLDLRGTSEAPLSSEQALQDIIRFFQPREKLPDSLPALQARYRMLLNKRRALIVADDAKDASQVRPLVPPAGNALLVTSRQRFLLDGMSVFDLEQLGEDAAIQLLRGVCGRLDETEAHQLALLCGCLPLALRLSASILANDPSLLVERYLALLADERQRLALLRDPDDPERNVTATLRMSYAALDEQTQTVFRSLGVLVADANLALVAAVLGQPEEQAEPVLRLLLRRCLVEYHADCQRWSMHDLVRVFALELLAGAGEERPVRLRYAQQVIQVIQQAEAHYQRGGEGVQAGLAQFDQERAHLDAVRVWLWGQPPDTLIDTMLIAEAHATQRIGQIRDLPSTVRVPQQKWAVAAARRQADARSEGRFLGNLGNAYSDLGNLDTAIGYHEQHLAIARSTGDRHGEGSALGNLGMVYVYLGEARTAINHLEQNLAITRETGNRVGESRALGNLGNAYSELGDIHAAITCYEQGLFIVRETGDQLGEGRTLGNLGIAYRRLGDPHTAMTYHRQNLALRKDLGDRRGEGTALANLGCAHADLGELDEALVCHEQHFTIARELGDQRGEAVALSHLGATHYLLENFVEALTYCEAARALAQKTGDRRLEATVLCEQANAQAALGRHKEAATHYEMSLSILDNVGDRGEGARTRWAYGQFLLLRGERERGVALMAQCVAYEQQLGHPQADEHATLLKRLQRD